MSLLNTEKKGGRVFFQYKAKLKEEIHPVVLITFSILIHETKTKLRMIHKWASQMDQYKNRLEVRASFSLKHLVMMNKLVMKAKKNRHLLWSKTLKLKHLFYLLDISLQQKLFGRMRKLFPRKGKTLKKKSQLINWKGTTLKF